VSYGPDAVDGSSFQLQQKTMGWWEATRIFLFTREGGVLALKLLAMAGLVGSAVDEPLDLIPGLNLLTVSDDVLWLLIPVWAGSRIWRIRHRANKPKASR